LGEAFTIPVNIINVLPMSVLHNHSPYEMLFKKKLDYHLFKVFGCVRYLLLKPYNHRKFGFHSSPCLFIGCLKHKDNTCISPP